MTQLPVKAADILLDATGKLRDEVSFGREKALDNRGTEICSTERGGDFVAQEVSMRKLERYFGSDTISGCGRITRKILLRFLRVRRS